MRAVIAAVLLCGAAWCGPAAAQAPASQAQQIAPDPAVRYGVLPNGLRYAVMRADRPAKGVSVRLHIEVGSYDEQDHELGAAHFVEHMAFNGTKNFAEDEMEPKFAAAGIAFGRDQNAWTNWEGTQYSADIALADPAKLDLVFRWLRDTADGQVFDPAAVERERRVVLAEHDRRLGPALALGEAIEQFRAPELRSTKRKPIGTRASLQAMTPAVLSDFHKRWYRPDNAVVVAVGDAPVADLERRIRDAFESWTAVGPLPERAAKSAPNLNRKLEVFARTEASAPTAVQSCLVRPATPDEPDTVAKLRGRAVRGLWAAALNDRLAKQARQADSPLLSGQVAYSQAYDEADYACLSATPLGENWRAGLESVTAEVRRMQAHGVTQAELDRAIRNVRASLERSVASAGIRTQPGLANAITGDLVDDEVFETPAESLRVFDAAVAGLTAAEVNAAFARDWSGAGPLINVIGPKVPVEAEVRTAWREAQARPVPAAYADVAVEAFPYTDFGPAGRVAKREDIAKPGFQRFTFENGLVLNFKALPSAVDQVGVSVAFGHGRRQIAPGDLNVARIGGPALTAGGLKRQSVADLRTALGDRRWGAGFGVGHHSFSFVGSTRPADLTLQMQVLAAYLSEPGFRPDFDKAFGAAVDLTYRALETSPEAAASRALAKTIAPGSPDDLPEKAVMQAISSRDFARVLGPILADSPLEITVVGDVQEGAAVQAVASTLGALPARTARPTPRADAWFFHFPETGPDVIRTTHKGDKDRAVVTAVWPLYVADPARRREERAINLLGQVLDTRIRRRIREALGQSYAPSVSVDMPDHTDQGRLGVFVQTSAADAERVRVEIEGVAAALAAGEGLDAVALEAERRAVLDRAAGRMDTLAWWMGALSGSASNDQNLRDQLDWEETYRSLTPEEVRAAAATWLKRKPVVVLSLPEATATEQAVKSQ